MRLLTPKITTFAGTGPGLQTATFARNGRDYMTRAYRSRGGQMRRIAFANRWPVLVAPVPRGANANALAPVAV